MVVPRGNPERRLTQNTSLSWTHGRIDDSSIRRSERADTPASGMSPASITNGRPDPATRQGNFPNRLSRTSIHRHRAS
jgi:hypothetical protein